MIISGESTTAEIKLPEEHVEDSLQDEIQEQVDHEAFQNPVKYMPDCHGGIGPHAIVGFSMKMGDRVVPNVIGGDIGCGMTAAKLSDVDVDFGEIDELRDLNEEVRQSVPMGTGRVNYDSGDFRWVFPWSVLNKRLPKLNTLFGPDVDKLEMYSMGYAEKLFDRVGIDKDYAEDSLGTLGGGNHFIEVAESESDGSYWVVVHSGSRNLGQKVKSYHQNLATETRDGKVHWEEMPGELRVYAEKDGTPRWDVISDTFEGEEIETVGERISEYSVDDNRNKDLDYLTGQQMYDYLRDMLFTQEYATTNRLIMVNKVVEALDASNSTVINSPHNYVDIHDGMIRKGSTRAADGEEFVIPMNMEDGTLLCRGKGNDEWNQSAPHGAGRLGSRGWAHSQFDADEVRQRMYDAGTYAATVPGDEVPEAYKPMQLIEGQIEPTAKVVDRLRPVVNFKA